MERAKKMSKDCPLCDGTGIIPEEPVLDEGGPLERAVLALADLAVSRFKAEDFPAHSYRLGLIVPS